MLPASDEYLIVALSGRALARAAQQAGVKVHVLDCCADTDTHPAALSTERVGTVREGFDQRRLLSVVASLCRRRPLAGIVTGSGFEDHTDLLQVLAQQLPLFGNPAGVVAKVKDPGEFFGCLKTLGIPHPETRTRLDDAAAGTWLYKRRGGAGGAHITLQKPAPATGNFFAQRQLTGLGASLVFLADGRRAHGIGFSRCWLAPTATAPYRYGGAVTIDPTSLPMCRAVVAAASTLVAAFALQGVCGLDFLFDRDGNWWLLELNPRAPASFELHEPSAWLFSAHLAACRGNGCFSTVPSCSRSRGHAVVYAGDNVTIADQFWPEWVRDRPRPGTRIARDEPICTVHAEAGTAAETRRLLLQRTVAIRRGVQQQQGGNRPG